MDMMLRRMRTSDINVHGFHSSFFDRASETGFVRDVVEATLAHVVGDKAEKATDGWRKISSWCAPARSITTDNRNDVGNDDRFKVVTFKRHAKSH